MLRTNDIVAEQASASDDFVAAMPYNSSKELEYGHDTAAHSYGAAGNTLCVSSCAE